MELDLIVAYLQESLYVIVVFGIFLVISFLKGRQTITNLILGLYLALLFTLQFPYFDQLFGNLENVRDQAFFSICIFIFFAGISTWLFTRILPREYSEKIFEGAASKLALAVAGTIVIMAFSFHALPVTELVAPGGPVSYLFSSAEYFFWWLIVPIVILFLF